MISACRPSWLLAATLLLAAAPAYAQSLESVVMPGQVISGHAKLESECSNCHVRFNKSAQTTLCLDCHKPVARDVEGKTGYHGRLAEKECRTCHTDHKGRDMNIAPVDPKTFDHRLTDFPLKGAHAGPKAACRDCHKPAVKWRDAPSDCNACHQKDDKHKGSLGTGCADCHGEQRWKDTRFDHARTRFPLTGKHREAGCKDCHSDPKFKGAPSTCVACHKKDDDRRGHRGRFGAKCETCHTDRGWKQNLFDHDKSTRYRLVGEHRRVKCSACHSGYLYKEKTPTTCVACHRADDQKRGHKGKFGDKCESCHLEKGWKHTIFNHDKATRYPLRGKHALAKCAACHTGVLYREKLQSGCIACHQKDDKHRGQEGRQCESCHNERSWKETRFDHGITRFPLLGKHARVECKKCHVTAEFRNASRECVACHRKDDKHALRLGPRCDDCHNARDWKKWHFDHDRQTTFRLDGKHQGLSCHACHKQVMPRKVTLAGTCASCHQEDDAHDGSFGRQCERCHVSSSFKKIRAGAGRLLQ